MRRHNDLGYITSTSVVFTVGLVILYCFRLPLNDDAGYFLPLARHLLQGDLPYLDVFNWHTPWGPVFYTPIATFSPEFLEYIAPFYLLLWNLMSAVIIAAFVLRYQQNVQLAILAGCWFLLMAIIVGGYYVTLEPIYLPMMLLAWYLADAEKANKRSWLLVGILLGLALMVKQFALVGILAVLPLAFRRKFWQVFLLGWSIPIVLTVLFFWANGLMPIDLFKNWLVPPGLSPYVDSEIHWLSFFFLTVPILMRISAGGLFSVGESFVQVIGLVCLLATYFIGGNAHYLLLVAGWIAPLLFEIKPLSSRFLLLSLITAILLALLGTFQSYKGKTKRAQLEQAAFLSSEITAQDRLIIPGTSHQYLYALTKAKPSYIREVGYQIFPFAPEELKQPMIDSATVILGTDRDLKNWDGEFIETTDVNGFPEFGLRLFRKENREPRTVFFQSRLSQRSGLKSGLASRSWSLSAMH